MIYGSPLETQDVASKGMLKELSPYLKRDRFDINDINPPAQVGYMFDGKIWGLASWNDTRVLSYNKNAFQAAGIPLPPQTLDGPGWTVDDFVNATRKLNDPANNKYAFVPEGTTDAALRFPWLFGGYFWNDEKVPTRSAMNTPEYVRGLEWARDLQTAHRVMPARTFAAQFGGHDKMFPSGHDADRLGGLQARDRGVGRDQGLRVGGGADATRHAPDAPRLAPGVRGRLTDQAPRRGVDGGEGLLHRRGQRDHGHGVVHALLQEDRRVQGGRRCPASGAG